MATIFWQEYPMGVLLFFVALLSTLFTMRESRRTISFLVPHEEIKVILFVPQSFTRSYSEWILDLISSLSTPCRIFALVEGTLAEQLQQSLLRPKVHVENIAIVGDDSPMSILRKLVNRFVTGNEQWVLIPHIGVKLRRRWDLDCIKMLSEYPISNAVLSCLPSDENDHPRFPVLRGSSVAKRGRAVRFDSHTACVAVPSVCWCPELTVASPSPLLATRSRGYAKLFDTNVTSLLPVVGPDVSLEAAITMLDPGIEMHVTAKMRSGLTEDASPDEKIIKYGSTTAARMATRLQSSTSSSD